MFYHSITEFVFLMNILGKRSGLPFLHKSDRKKEKSTVSFTHEQNIICSQTLLDGIAHEQTIICRQLFAGHMVGSRPMKRNTNFLRMIMHLVYPQTFCITTVFYFSWDDCNTQKESGDNGCAKFGGGGGKQGALQSM